VHNQRTIGSRRAVTLIEVLVTVAVAVILTLIVIVGMRSVRGQTLAMKDLHNLRLSGQDILLWSVDNDGKVLNIETPDSKLYRIAYPSLPSPDFNLYLSLYFSQFVNWHEFLKALHGVEREHWVTAYRARLIQAPSGAPPVALERQHFQLSPTLHTAAELWTNPTPAATSLECAPYIKTVRFSSVRYPAGKGLIAHLDIPDTPETAHILFVDGSTERLSNDMLQPPTNNPRSRSRGPGRPVLHTLYGYNGRDR
jgi:prepilin-type N-terminal cleavage/methylation domain-containing protein